MNICNSDSFLYNRGYIYFPLVLNSESFPKKIHIRGEDLILKSSFHVSLVYLPNILEKINDERGEEKILNLFCQCAQDSEICFDGFTGEYRFAEREADGRKSLVAMCTMKNLNNFYQKLKDQFNVTIDTPPTHISLYTLKLDEAIGINNTKDLENLTIAIEGKDIEDIHKFLLNETKK